MTKKEIINFYEKSVISTVNSHNGNIKLCKSKSKKKAKAHTSNKIIHDVYKEAVT